MVRAASIESGRRAAVDRDGGALDLSRALGAQEQCERRNILRGRHAPRPALGDGGGANLIDRLAECRRALLQQLLGALGRGLTGMDRIDVDTVAHTEPRQPLGEVRGRGIDRTADQELGLDRARRPADDVDDVAFRRLEQRPEQSGQPHCAKEFQGDPAEPELVGQPREIAGALGAGIVDEHGAAWDPLVNMPKQLLAARKRAQIAGDGERLRSRRADDLGGGGEIGLRRGGQYRLRAGTREGERDAAADAAAPSGYDDDLALELARHVEPPCVAAVAVLLWPAMAREKMKSIFIDCNNQLAPVFARMRRPDDPPIAVNTDPFQSADLPDLLAGYDICLDAHSYLPTAHMASCRGLKHVVFLGTGVSSYRDVTALNGLGIEVHTIKGYGDTAVAEHAMALIFACGRELARMDRAVRAGVWEPLESMQLSGKTLGLIGVGGIGREVARIASGIGMRVMAWNRSPRSGLPLVNLDELLAEADVITLHLALNDETHGFISAERIAQMKPGVILVNTARGALVDEDALTRALASGHVRHAGLDVFHDEPLRPDHPFIRMENVTLTSHAAFRTLEASETLMRRALAIARPVAAP